MAFSGMLGVAVFNVESGVSSPHQTVWMLFCIAVVVLSLWRIIITIQRVYVCPSCKKVPRKTRGALWQNSLTFGEELDLNPAECRHCGAQLQ